MEKKARRVALIVGAATRRRDGRKAKQWQEGGYPPTALGKRGGILRQWGFETIGYADT